jgi:AAA15 family ATPase/GTPase
MILELKIQNYLSFKDEVTFSFEATSDTNLEEYYIAKQDDGTRILKMAMVYGANASGKSNLIKAFEFINDFVSSMSDENNYDSIFIPFLFDDTKDKPGRFELIFYVQGKKHKYQLIIGEKLVLEEKLFFYPGTQPAIIFNRYYNEKKKISVVEFGSKIKISEQALEAIQLKTLNNISVFTVRKQVNISIPQLDKVKDWFDKNFMNAINPYHSLTKFSDFEIKNNPKIKEHALNFLKEADFNIVDIWVEDKIQPISDDFIKYLEFAPIPEERKAKIKEEKAVHVDETVFKHRVISKGKESFFSLSRERQSKGTERFYGLSVPFFHATENDAFLPVDEIGSALHPLLVIHFLKQFLQKSNQAQLLFTTHNLSLLNEKDILRKDAIWFTEKREDGSTSIYSLADFNFRKELSFYNAYKQGKFGAVPMLED